MKIQQGDKVRFLNSIGGGIVTKIEGHTVYVEDEDGFEIPTNDNEVVVVEQQAMQKQQIEEKRQEEKKSEIAEIKVDTEYKYNDNQADDENPHFALSFLKSDKGNSGYLDLYVVNDSNNFVFFSITEVADNNKVRMLHYGTIEPNTKLMLDKYNPQRIDNQSWQCQLILFRKNKVYTSYQPISSNTIKIKSSKFYHDGGFVDNDYFNEKAVIFQVIKDELQSKIEELSEKDFHKVIEKKEQKELPKQSKRRVNEIIEIDLHIDEVVDSIAGLSNGDMLEAQIHRFRSVMEEYATSKGQRIVFIHGVGNGRLKAEVRKVLDREYRKCNYQDASFKEYGYGATMVTIC